MKVLSLFSGIGLLDLGLAWAGMRTVGLCEIEPYCRWVLEQHWPGVPIWSDVREVTGDAVRERCGAVDLVAGGFPCQPVSVAGARKGHADDRWLWPEMLRVVREVRPAWVLAENVPGLRTTAADEVLADLDVAGYSCWPLVMGADDVGAPHRRKRVWIVAHRDGGGQHRQRLEGGDAEGQRGREGAPGDEPDGCGARPVGEPTGPGLEGQRADAGEPQESEHRHAGDPTLLRGWPARPGEQQREWEAPRLAYTGRERGEWGPHRHRQEGSEPNECHGREPAGASGGARQPEPGMGGSVDGSARWLARSRSAARRARLKALGNGVVPQVVAEVGRAILAAEAGLRAAA